MKGLRLSVAGIVLCALAGGGAAMGAMAPQLAGPAPHGKDRNIAGILIFDGVQIIDFTGPYEVFGQARFDVFTVAARREPITTSMGLKVTPRYTFDDAPALDVLVLPGGNVDGPMRDPATQAFIKRQAKEARVVLSVCNGAFTLAMTGLLDGLSATTYAGLIEEFRLIAPKTHVVTDKRFVDNGKIVTSAGLSSGLDASLHVVEKLVGLERARRVAANLEYDWDPNRPLASKPKS